MATPDFDFGFSDELLLLRDQVARFATERISRRARPEIDRKQRVPSTLAQLDDWPPRDHRRDQFGGADLDFSLTCS